MDDIQKYKGKNISKWKSKETRRQVEGWGQTKLWQKNKKRLWLKIALCIATPLPEFPIIDWFDQLEHGSTLASVDKWNISCNQVNIGVGD